MPGTPALSFQLPAMIPATNVPVSVVVPRLVVVAEEIPTNHIVDEAVLVVMAILLPSVSFGLRHMVAQSMLR